MFDVRWVRPSRRLTSHHPTPIDPKRVPIHRHTMQTQRPQSCDESPRIKRSRCADHPPRVVLTPLLPTCAG